MQAVQSVHETCNDKIEINGTCKVVKSFADRCLGWGCTKCRCVGGIKTQQKPKNEALLVVSI